MAISSFDQVLGPYKPAFDYCEPPRKVHSKPQDLKPELLQCLMTGP